MHVLGQAFAVEHVLTAECATIIAAFAWVASSLPDNEKLFVLVGILVCGLFAQMRWTPSPGWRKHASSGAVVATMLFPLLFAVRSGAHASQCFYISSYCSLHAALRPRGIDVFSVGIPLMVLLAIDAEPYFAVLPLLSCVVAIYFCEHFLARSFSFAEAIICAQVWALMCCMVFLFLHDRLGLTKLRTIILLGLFIPITYAAFIIMLSKLPFASPKSFAMQCGYFSFGAATVCLMLACMTQAIGENSLVWLFEYVTARPGTPLKFIVYFVITFGLCIVCSLPIMGDHVPRTIMRKYFHLFALIMFVPTIFIHLRFMALFFACAFSLTVVLEALRVVQLEPLASFLHSYMRHFLDSRDDGTMVLSHIYLLVGCSITVWYTLLIYGGIFSANSLLVAFSGITCTGLADATAAVVGSTLGVRRWGHNKTVEGSFAFVISSILFQAALLWYAGFDELSAQSWFRLILADVLTCLLEATSDQVDNVILPVFHMTLLQIV